MLEESSWFIDSIEMLWCLYEPFSSGLNKILPYSALSLASNPGGGFRSKNHSHSSKVNKFSLKDLSFFFEINTELNEKFQTVETQT